MATLTGRLIKQYVESGELGICPFDETRIEPASYDARLGSKILASPLGPTELGEVIQLTEEDSTYEILTGQMVAVMSHERFEIPLDLVCGNFGIRSHFARRGIIPFGGTQLDPGWRGNLILNLQNVGPEPVAISLGEPLFTIQFDRLEEPAEQYSGPHQDQHDFPSDQVDFILSARTTSLAEIPTMRSSIERLQVMLEDIHEHLFDPDRELEVAPAVRDRLLRSLESSPEELLTSEQFWARPGV